MLNYDFVRRNNMKIIGYRVNKFDTSDGHHIEGVTFI